MGVDIQFNSNKSIANCSRSRHTSVMLMSSLLAVIKYVVWVDMGGDPWTRGPGGLGGKWAVNRDLGNSVEHTCSRRSRRGLVQEDKRMAFVYTHGLFIT
jgi:hypothetical protein